MCRGAGTELVSKTLGCLIGGLIGDFDADGTDDTIMKTLLCRALVRSGGYASADDWAHEWLSDPNAIFGEKRNRFFISVLHTARKLRDHTTPRTAALGNMPSSSSAMAIAPVGIVNACNPRQAAMQTSVTYGANFGRDTDTIATRSGAIAGALNGVGSIPPRWVEKAKRLSATDQDELAAELAAVALQKADIERSARERLEGLVAQ